MAAIQGTYYDPLAAFSSFTHDELVTAIRAWIQRCDRVEAECAELLDALHCARDALDTDQYQPRLADRIDVLLARAGRIMKVA